MATQQQVLEDFNSMSKQRAMESRVRQSVKGGLVEVLNVGYEQGKRLFVPRHNRYVEMPAPGATFMVPREIAFFLMNMPMGKKLQLVRGGQKPANFTPPPGYKLVPVEPVQEEVSAEEMLQQAVEREEEHEEE